MNELWKWIAGAAVVFAILTGWRLDVAQGRLAAEMVRADSIRGEILVDSLRADSTLAVEMAEVVDLRDMLAAGDSTAQALQGRLDRANARATALSRFKVTAEAQIGSLADSLALVSDSIGVQVSASGTLDDGLLLAPWRFDAPPGELQLTYTVSPKFEQIQTQLGDGRIAVIARSLDPRVQIEVLETFVDPPPPVVEFRISKNQAGVIFGVGFVLGVLLR